VDIPLRGLSCPNIQSLALPGNPGGAFLFPRSVADQIVGGRPRHAKRLCDVRDRRATFPCQLRFCFRELPDCGQGVYGGGPVLREQGEIPKRINTRFGPARVRALRAGFDASFLRLDCL